VRVVDADVIIVGAGPVGLMLAGELRMAGVRALVLERKSRRGETPKANGLGGQILQLLRYRGLLDRFEAASADPHPTPIFPFGGVHLDFTRLADPPLHAIQLAQQELERVLDERAGELGAEVRRGHEVLGVSQDDAMVTAEVRGPDGPYRVTARYLAGCDGAHSRVRDWAGIAFPGTTYPEVSRLGQVTVAESVTQLPSGDLDVPGLGVIRRGFTRTDRGLFAFGSLNRGALYLQTVEDEHTEYDDDLPMTLTELQDSIRRVLGGDLPVEDPRRLSRFTFQARQAQRYRDGRILLAGDAAHLLPATGAALNLGMLDAVNLAWKLAADIRGWAPADLLDTYQNERRFAGARALLQTQAQVALRRGHDAAAEALQEVFSELLADEQPQRRVGAMIAGTDIRYPLPGPSQHALTGTFAPDLALHIDSPHSGSPRTGRGATSVAELMRTARPVLLDLADRADLREAARDWGDRVDIYTAESDDRPADALLIRPDACVAWAASVGEAAGTAVPALRDALSCWFGSHRVAAGSPPGNSRGDGGYTPARYDKKGLKLLSGNLRVGGCHERVLAGA
jgi:2-polyprenyl-6-methoxyphenol hydroxylase-like FAD-dependent oxidoreductase